LRIDYYRLRENIRILGGIERIQKRIPVLKFAVAFAAKGKALVGDTTKEAMKPMRNWDGPGRVGKSMIAARMKLIYHRVIEKFNDIPGYDDTTPIRVESVAGGATLGSTPRASCRSSDSRLSTGEDEDGAGFTNDASDGIGRGKECLVELEEVIGKLPAVRGNPLPPNATPRPIPTPSLTQSIVSDKLEAS
jgi:hypothetical protein